MRRLFGQSLLFSAIASMVLSDDLPVTHTDAVGIPDIPQPGYLESYLDPTFGAEVIRITGDPGTDIPHINGRWAPIARHHYSKDSAWNADQSLLLLQRHHGYPSMLFLDGTSYRPLFGRNKAPGADMRWHPEKPDILVFVRDNLIGYWDVRADSAHIVAVLPGYSEFRLGPWEGNLSLDGRLIAIDGRKGKDRIAFAYDLVEGRKYPDLVLNDVVADWISVSPSGEHLVLHGKICNEKGDQTQVFDLDGNKIGELWSEYGRPSHYDMTIDQDGEDVAVGVSKSEPDCGRVIKRRLCDGKVTVLTAGGYGSHTSTRNVNRRGWAYVTYQHRGPTWPPYWNEVVAVRLDGSMEVERIAHLHTRRTDYLSEAHAVPSPDGARVLWASNWEAALGRPLGTYVARRATGEVKYADERGDGCEDEATHARPQRP
jgi:hypothetical protein